MGMSHWLTPPAIKAGSPKVSHKYQYDEPPSTVRQEDICILSAANHQMPRCYLYLVPKPDSDYGE